MTDEPPSSIVALLSRAVSCGDVKELEDAMRSYEAQLASSHAAVAKATTSVEQQEGEEVEVGDAAGSTNVALHRLAFEELTSAAARLAYEKAQRTYLRHLDVCRHDLLSLRTALNDARFSTVSSSDDHGGDAKHVHHQHCFKKLSETLISAQRSTFRRFMARDIQEASLFLSRVREAGAHARQLLEDLQSAVCTHDEVDTEEEEEELVLLAAAIERFVAAWRGYVPLVVISELGEFRSRISGAAKPHQTATGTSNKDKKADRKAVTKRTERASPSAAIVREVEVDAGAVLEAAGALVGEETARRRGVAAYETQSRATLLSRHLQMISHLRLQTIIAGQSFGGSKRIKGASQPSAALKLRSSSSSSSSSPENGSQDEENSARERSSCASSTSTTSSGDDRQLRHFLNAFSNDDDANPSRKRRSTPPLPVATKSAAVPEDQKLQREEDADDKERNAVPPMEFVDVPEDDTVVEAAIESKVELSVEEARHRDHVPTGRRRPQHTGARNGGREAATEMARAEEEQDDDDDDDDDPKPAWRGSSSSRNPQVTRGESDGRSSRSRSSGKRSTSRYPVEDYLELFIAPEAATRTNRSIPPTAERSARSSLEADAQSADADRRHPGAGGGGGSRSPSPSPASPISSVTPPTFETLLLRRVFTYPFSALTDAEAHSRQTITTQEETERHCDLRRLLEALQHQHAVQRAQLLQLVTVEGRMRRDVEQQEVGAREGGILVSVLRERGAMVDRALERGSQRTAVGYAEDVVRRKIGQLEHESFCVLTVSSPTMRDGVGATEKLSSASKETASAGTTTLANATNIGSANTPANERFCCNYLSFRDLVESRGKKNHSEAEVDQEEEGKEEVHKRATAKAALVLLSPEKESVESAGDENDGKDTTEREVPSSSCAAPSNRDAQTRLFASPTFSDFVSLRTNAASSRESEPPV